MKVNIFRINTGTNMQILSQFLTKLNNSYKNATGKIGTASC